MIITFHGSTLLAAKLLPLITAITGKPVSAYWVSAEMLGSGFHCGVQQGRFQLMRPLSVLGFTASSSSKLLIQYNIA